MCECFFFGSAERLSLYLIEFAVNLCKILNKNKKMVLNSYRRRIVVLVDLYRVHFQLANTRTLDRNDMAEEAMDDGKTLKVKYAKYYQVVRVFVCVLRKRCFKVANTYDDGERRREIKKNRNRNPLDVIYP